MADFKNPCIDCHKRKEYAKYYDFHFWGDDCPYDCKRYKYYRCFTDGEPAELKCKECPYKDICS